MKNKRLILIVPFILLAGCSKDFLNKKPKTTLVIPTTIEDFDALLDNFSYVNTSPSLSIISADNYYIPTYALYQSCKIIAQKAYIWDSDLLKGESTVPDWNNTYTAIFYANNVIEGVKKNFATKDSAAWNNLLGRALFIRGKAFYDLANEFAPPYDSATAETQLGLPLKLKPGVDETVNRASIKKTYDQIISDLKSAKQLLAETFPDNFTYKPSKIAADAMIARVYLSMRKYSEAEVYADSALTIKNDLIDFNNLDTNSTIPIGFSSIETLYYIEGNSQYYKLTISVPSLGSYSVDSNLLQSYSENDLRFSIFFQKNNYNGYLTRRGYAYNFLPFTGLALDEVYLIKAECAARRNDNIIALKYLNELLTNRYKVGTYVPYSYSDGMDLLDLILKERRKELVYRGLRWSDLRRLNLEGRNITLKRILNGQTYTLEPNDPKYTLPIPDNEIFYGGIKQNER